jgi:hypothetical protein
MTPTSSRPRSKNTIREKRKVRFLGIIAKMLGCVALVLMVAAVFGVVMAKMWELPGAESVMAEARQDSAAPTDRTGLTPAAVIAVVSPEAPAAVVDPAPVPKAVPLPFPVNAVPSGITLIESKGALIARSLTGFFTAESIDEKLQWVRDPERVRPLMASFYAAHEFKPQAFAELGWVRSVEEPGFRFGYVQARFENAEPVSVIVEELADGRVVVDWESSVRYGEMSWKEFLQAKPERPTLLRLLAYRAESSMGMVGEGQAKKWEVVLVKHPSDDAALEAHFDPNDPEMFPLLDQLQAGQWKEVPLTLRLCFLGEELNSNKKIARITAVEGRGWLILPQKRS